MKLKFPFILLLSLVSSLANSQSRTLSVIDIKQNSLQFSLGDMLQSNVFLEYGLSTDLELGQVNGLSLKNLADASFYYVKANSLDGEIESDVLLFATASKSSGDITVYFNQSVDNSASSLADAVQVSAFEDTLIAYIDRALNTLDVSNYNTGSLPIVNAINAAEARGVVVRYIAADNTGTNNSELSNLSATIPMIQRPSDGEVMHNKFLIIDVANSATATVVTGSVNHTDNSCHQDYNNMVIVEDQTLALTYKTEFEEMWGATGNVPNLTNAKFGSAKTDNTPHSFSIGGVLVEQYFSPSDGTTSKIETAVLSADTDMQFATLTYTNNVLGDAVISIHNLGVDVKGIIENILYFGSEYNGLLNAGVDVYSHFSEPHFFHHKYAIVDANNISSDPVVVTGSHNWSNSAEDDYDENTLIIHDAEIANMYYEEFMARYAEMNSGTGLSELNGFVDVSMYPNPMSEVLYIKAESRITSIVISNTIGQVVHSIERNQTNEIEVNTSILIEGVYFIEVKITEGTKVKRVVKL